MSEVTKPLMLDETGQAIAEAIRGIGLGNYVIVNVNNAAWGKVNGGGLYPPGVEVTLTFTPRTGCYFVALTDMNGNVLTTQSTYTFTPTANTVFNAIFSESGTVRIVPWSTGTDAEIKAMLDAHYAGIINVHDFWKVGDKRLSSWNAFSYETVSFQAKDCNLVLMDATLMGISPADDDIASLAFAVGSDYVMSPYNSLLFVSGWSTYAYRDMLNTTYIEDGVPAAISQLFKPFKWKHYERGSLVETTDIAGYPTAKNVFGDASTAGASENDLYNQWDYYKNASNRLKSGKTALWHGWSTSSSRLSCQVNDDVSTPTSHPGSFISPFSCI